MANGTLQPHRVGDGSIANAEMCSIWTRGRVGDIVGYDLFVRVSPTDAHDIGIARPAWEFMRDGLDPTRIGNMCSVVSSIAAAEMRAVSARGKLQVVPCSVWYVQSGGKRASAHAKP